MAIISCNQAVLLWARRKRVACLRVLRQISAKDAHNVQHDGLAFGKDKRNFDPPCSFWLI